MNKINLCDKFFHSPNWDDSETKPGERSINSLDRFRGILKKGYILSSSKLGVKSPWRCDSNKVYLAVYPKGYFSSIYNTGNSGITGYEMATKGFYFILDAKIKDDYDIIPGSYKYECVVFDKIDLYKYLIGIGNAGYSIDNFFEICYFLIEYINGEISESSLIGVISERSVNSYFDISMNAKAYINHCFNTDNFLNNNTLSKDPKEFISIGKYYDILRVLEEEKKSIPLYDMYGCLIDPARRITDVENMMEYIKANRDIVNNEEARERLKELYKSLR